MGSSLWFKRLSQMNGRIALIDEEADCISYYAGMPGDHVEIGCLWGGSALIAALTKIEANIVGDVYIIDHMEGLFWKDKDPAIGRAPKPKDLLYNLHKFGADWRTHIIMAASNPWPLNPKVEPVTMFIDGDHNYAPVLKDWENARKVTSDYILLHDYSKGHPGVKRAIDEVVMKDPDWRLVKVAHSIAVFERVNG